MVGWMEGQNGLKWRTGSPSSERDGTSAVVTVGFAVILAGSPPVVGSETPLHCRCRVT